MYNTYGAGAAVADNVVDSVENAETDHDNQTN
jgi:hypothetical protein